MSSKLIERRLNEFQRRCGNDGDAALELACYAALPVALNPELLHFLRINFFFDPPKQLPYTVEFEFFTSGLCRAIDVELYEIEPETRNELLKRLMERNDDPQQIQDVATLLWHYVEHHSPWADRVELERAQQLTALHFLNPKKAQEWLDEANADNSQNGGGQEWFIAMRQEIQDLERVKEFNLSVRPWTSSNFQKNDRVVVTRGEYSNEYGRVVDGEYKGFLFHETLIHLDKDGQMVNIPVGDLKHEDLRPNEVNAAIKNVLNQVTEVASQLPGEMGKELPNHVGYLGKAIMSKEKLASKYELDYVMNNLKKASEVGSVTPEWMERTRINLEKISWSVKRLS